MCREAWALFPVGCSTCLLLHSILPDNGCCCALGGRGGLLHAIMIRSLVCLQHAINGMSLVLWILLSLSLYIYALAVYINSVYSSCTALNQRPGRWVA
jgi:hypothetical protein